MNLEDWFGNLEKYLAHDPSDSLLGRRQLRGIQIGRNARKCCIDTAVGIECSLEKRLGSSAVSNH